MRGIWDRGDLGQRGLGTKGYWGLGGLRIGDFLNFLDAIDASGTFWVLFFLPWPQSTGRLKPCHSSTTLSLPRFLSSINLSASWILLANTPPWVWGTNSTAFTSCPGQGLSLAMVESPVCPQSSPVGGQGFSSTLGTGLLITLSSGFTAAEFHIFSCYFRSYISANFQISGINLVVFSKAL